MGLSKLIQYLGLLCMVGLAAMLGAGIESRIFYKNLSGKKRFRAFVFSTYSIALFTFFFLKFTRRTDLYRFFDKLTAGQFIFGFIIVLLVALVKIGLTAFLQKHSKPYTDTNENNKRTLRTLRVLGVVLFSFGFSFFMIGHFVPTTWGGIRPEQMIVNVISPTSGTERSIYLTGVEYLILAVGFSIFFGIICFNPVRIEFQKGRKGVAVLSGKAKAISCFVLALVMFVSSSFYISNALSLPVVRKIFFVPSDFVEKEYVDLRDVKVTFPEQKRNLIYIYLESMENSYLSKDLGGYMEENLMPELAELTYEGDVFSNTAGKFGGPIQVTGTEWSIASMINQTLGLPMKAPKNLNAYKTPDHFLGGAYGLGDLLHDNGYEQSFLVGSTAMFAGLDLMMKTHGDFKVIDYDYACETGMIPAGYKVWWGFEDDRLFDFAKEELLELSKNGKPFNMTIETCDTHAPDGYLPDGAPAPYDDHYANSIAYNTRRVTEFVRWVQKQPFYENTTIIMIGDHHSMDSAFFEKFDKDYIRTTFNLILNPAESVKTTDASRFVNRKYANFDMLPTTLAALGCEVEGDRAGIGVNLYSPQKTLLETYGIEYVDGELQKRSDFYNNTIVDVP